MERDPKAEVKPRRKTKSSIEKEELVRKARRNTQDGGLTAGGVKGAEELLRCLDGREQNEEAAAQIDVLRQTFNLFDADKDGLLCVDEFRRLLSVMGLDVTVDEAEDLMSDVDSDGTGKMEFDEFIVLLSKRQDKTSADLEGAWRLLDPDARGSFETGKLKELMLIAGIQLDMWEMEEMVAHADLNKDGVINKREFMQASKAQCWQRCSRLGEVYENIVATWNMLDIGNTGKIDASVIQTCFKRMGCTLSKAELSGMFMQADDNQDGEIDFSEFAVAYHSKTWRRARLLGPLQKKLRKLRTSQERMYAAWHKREVEEARECGLFPPGTCQTASRTAGLVQRRKLRRDRTVRKAVMKMWESLAGARMPASSAHCDTHIRDWVDKDLFTTVILHFLKHHSEDDDFFLPEARDMADEEWSELAAKPIDIMTQTLHQKARSNTGDLRWMTKPEGVDCIGYSKFFGAIFEAVDSLVGFEQNIIDASAYAECVDEMFNHLVCEKDGMYHWKSPELAQGKCPLTFEVVELVPVEDVELDPNSDYYKRMMEASAIAIQKSMRGFQERKKLRTTTKYTQAMESKSTPTITSEQYAICKRDFDKIDTNGNEKLDRSELIEFLSEQLRRKPTDDEIKDLTLSMDFDGDGKVTLSEYISSVYGSGWTVIQE